MGAFSKRGKKNIHEQSITTLISEGSVINGNIHAPAYARIDGHIKGDATIEGGLILGEKGHIEGMVNAGEIVIYGAVNGNITAGSVEIMVSGKVYGDIRTGILAIENGGICNGQVLMNRDNPNAT